MTLRPFKKPGTAPHSGFRDRLLFRGPQPRKLCVERVDGFGGGFQQRHSRPHGGGRWRREPAAGSVVATGGPASVSAKAAQLFWRFVEQDIEVLGHGVFRTPHSLALVEGTKQVEKFGFGSDPYEVKAMPGQVRILKRIPSLNKALQHDSHSVLRAESEVWGRQQNYRIGATANPVSALDYPAPP